MERVTESKKLDLAPLDALLESPVMPSYTLDKIRFLKAVLTDPPQQLVEDGSLNKIEWWASKVVSIIPSFDLKKIDEEMARELGERLNFILILMSHWMDLVRMIYDDKEPKPSRVYFFMENLQVPVVIDPLDALLELVYESPVMPSSSKETFAELALLRAFLMDPPQQFVRDGTLKKLESMAREAESVISKFDLKKMDKKMARKLRHGLHNTFNAIVGSFWKLSYPARMIYAERPKPSRIFYPKTGQLGFVDHLVEYLKELIVRAKADDSLGPLKLDVLWFQRKLQSVSCRLMDIPEPRKKEADLKDLMTNITNLAYEAEYAIDSFLVRDIPIWYCMFWLRGILEEFKPQRRLIKMEFGDTQSTVSSILNFSSPELSIIPVVNYNSEIGETLRQVFNDPAIIYMFQFRTWSLVSSYKERKKEVFFQLLNNAYVEEDSDRNIAFTSDVSEDELEKLLFGLLKDDKKYFIILEDVRDIDALDDIRRVLPDNKYSRILLTTPSPELALLCRNGFNNMSEHRTSTSETKKPTTNDDVVGFKAETKMMLERLIGESKQLRILSIVGMAGQGKTTLAKKLYCHPSVVDYFDIRIWCYVSQVYEKRELLLELLDQVVQLSNTIFHKNDEELAEVLYKHLKGRRFLVFLDDMWKIDAWNDLRRCFPNDNNGSRIMFTTRIQELASQARSDSILQPLCPLTDDESWELLEKKLFHKESYPPELLGVGRQIAKNCRGLPLSVVLTAGLLGKMEKKVDQWDQIVERLSSHILGDAEARAKAIIELSYNHLPDHAKPCFLYFGAFVGDREISVSKLIRLWIAEGFIKHTELKNSEDVSEDYLMDLIGRSLVTIAQEKSNGGVKSCRVHDLLREFCLIKATEEKFLQLIHEYDELFPSSTDNLDYGLDPNYSFSPTPTKYHVCRLCIYSKSNHFFMLKPTGPLVRSLLFFAATDTCPTYSYDISFISHYFKLLKILDLEDINIGEGFNAICMLVHLRYLALQGDVDSIPSSIVNLWNLETFCIKALEGKVIKVPDSIWDITKLRHVHINVSASFDLNPHRLEHPSLLDNMQSFSTPSLAYGDDMEKIMRRLRGMRKLKCIFLDSWDDARNCNRFPALELLSQLVSLKVFYNGTRKYPCEFNFPSNLKKLTLSNFRVPWYEFPQLAMLCNLEVLKLLGNAFEGEAWEMEDEKFPKLKFLKLDTLNVVKWSASRENFPSLERLLLHKCEQLEEIPSDIGDITTLQVIEVMWCSRPAAISAERIQEEQLDFGNEGFKVHVHPKVWDYESPS